MRTLDDHVFEQVEEEDKDTSFRPEPHMDAKIMDIHSAYPRKSTMHSR
jgi:hypothetical protein